MILRICRRRHLQPEARHHRWPRADGDQALRSRTLFRRTRTMTEAATQSRNSEIKRLRSELSEAIDRFLRYVDMGPVVFFVGKNGIAHGACDWASTLRVPRLEASRNDCHGVTCERGIPAAVGAPARERSRSSRAGKPKNPPHPADSDP